MGNSLLVIQKAKLSAYQQLILASGGGGTLPWQSDRYARRIFQGIKFLILVFFRVFWKVLCRNEILVFLGSAPFPYRVKVSSFQKVLSKICIFLGIAPATWVFLEL